MNTITILDNRILNDRAVNARDLHYSLGSKQEFGNWIRNKVVENESFIYGEDYVLLDNSIRQTKGRGGHNKVDYALSLDTAKNVALMEHTDAGNDIRRYFIRCEKELVAKLPHLPSTFSEALMLAANQAKELEQKTKLLEERKPKVDFFDAVTNSKTAVSMNDAAKVLDIGIGRNGLFEFLRANNVLMNSNRPYQKYVDCGYFRVIEQRYMRAGEECINFKTLVYQRGLSFIKKLINKSRDCIAVE